MFGPDLNSRKPERKPLAMRSETKNVKCAAFMQLFALGLIRNTRLQIDHWDMSYSCTTNIKINPKMDQTELSELNN